MHTDANACLLHIVIEFPNRYVRSISLNHKRPFKVFSLIAVGFLQPKNGTTTYHIIMEFLEELRGKLKKSLPKDHGEEQEGHHSTMEEVILLKF